MPFRNVYNCMHSAAEHEVRAEGFAWHEMIQALLFCGYGVNCE